MTREHNIKAVLECVFSESKEELIDIAVKNIMALEQPSRPKGHWVHKGQGIYCSKCGEESGYNPFGASRFSDYCPSCGIEMEIEE